MVHFIVCLIPPPLPKELASDSMYMQQHVCSLPVSHVSMMLPKQSEIGNETIVKIGAYDMTSQIIVPTYSNIQKYEKR
jgi:hypothetical protein